MKDFNLVATTRRFAEEHAEDELLAMLESFGDEEATTEITGVTGLIECHASMDPFKVTELLSKALREEPWSVRYLLRVIPIQSTVGSKLEDIAEQASILASRIPAKDSYRITVEKRHCALKSADIISSIADRIYRQVNLSQPDWTVSVQVIAGETGLSVLKDNQIFNSVLEKRK